jgi:hypothetical protein
MSLSAECLKGLVLETLYIDNQSDFDKLGPGYQKPACYSFGGHICNRALFGIFANNVFLDVAKLNNGGTGTLGPFYQGVPKCQDFENIHPNWNPGTLSRYNKKIISLQEAEDILQNSTLDCVVRFRFDAALNPGETICGPGGNGNGGPHGETAWFRITNKSGEVLFNNCFSSTQSTQDINLACALCLVIEFVDRITPRVTSQRSCSAVPQGKFNNKEFYRVYDNTNNYKTLGYIMYRNNRWEFWEKFPIVGGSRQASGMFYGYNNDPGNITYPTQAGTWVVGITPSAIDQKKIISGVCGAPCAIPDDDKGCDCEGLIVKPDFNLNSNKKKYLPILNKIKEDRC